MNTVTVKVGDELAVDYQIRRVVKLSATGRITLDSGTVLNPDLSIRGANSWGPYRAHLLTDQMREKCELREFRFRIERLNSEKLTTDQRRRIVAILDEGAAQ